MGLHRLNTGIIETLGCVEVLFQFVALDFASSPSIFTLLFAGMSVWKVETSLFTPYFYMFVYTLMRVNVEENVVLIGSLF